MKTTLIALFLALTVSVPVIAANSEVHRACESDVKSLCSGVERGGGRIKQCIKEHREQLSSGCKQALIEKKNESGNHEHGRGRDNASDTSNRSSG